MNEFNQYLLSVYRIKSWVHILTPTLLSLASQSPQLRVGDKC